MKWLHNRKNKAELAEDLKNENFDRKTISFYNYVKIDNPEEMRDDLFLEWSDLGCLGRIYIAKEGINAQMNVPEHRWGDFVEKLYLKKEFVDVPFKIGVEQPNDSFLKLKIMVKDKIVADGIDDKSFNPSNTGEYMDASAFNEAIDDGAVLVDMRNHYESEVGRFETAICPDVDTFREELEVVESLIEKDVDEDKKVLIYCTGGIRCEKASAYLKHRGFKNVYHLKGGIIDYAHEVKEKGLESKFKGKNFVFDERMGERITDDVISNCHQCGEKSDNHINCENNHCHLLFIQCNACETVHEGQYCGNLCRDVDKQGADVIMKKFDNLDEVPKSTKIKLGIKMKHDDCLAVYKHQLRPRLKDWV